MALTLSATVTRLSTLAHRHTLRVWLVWGCGILAFAALPVALMDPPVLMLLLDPELLALIVISTAGLIHVRPRPSPTCGVSPRGRYWPGWRSRARVLRGGIRSVAVEADTASDGSRK